MKTAFQGKIRPPREGEAPASAALVVGAYLRAVRLSRGMSGSEAAWGIGGSAAKVSRLETGRLHRVADAIRLLEYYGIDSKAHLRAVDHLFQKPHRHVLYDAVPGWLDRLHACQRQADSTVIHTGHALPDFLRIPDYPVGLMAQHFRAELQLHVPPRAPLTAGTGGDVTLLLDEMGLHRPLGDPDVMPAQIAHLKQLTSSPQGPRILVVPQRVLPPRGLLLYQMTLHGHELVAEEWANFVIYHTGEALEPWQHRLRVAMDAAVPLDDAAVCVNEGRAPVEEQAAAPSPPARPVRTESRLYLAPGGEGVL